MIFKTGLYCKRDIHLEKAASRWSPVLLQYSEFWLLSGYNYLISRSFARAIRA